MSRWVRPWWENGAAMLAAGAWIVFVACIASLSFGVPEPVWAVILGVFALAVAVCAAAVADSKKRQ